MTVPADRTPRALWLHVALVTFSLPAAVMTNFLLFNHYPLTRPECLLIYALLAAIAAGVGRFAACCPPIGLLLLSGVIVFYVDFILPMASISEVTLRGAPKMGVILLATALVYLLVRRGGRRLVTIMGIIAAAMLAASGGQHWMAPPIPMERVPQGKSGALRQDLPLILHIVFDEHIGRAGIPEDVPAGSELKRSMQDFYEKYGFLLFDNAYSHYLATDQSLIGAMSFQEPPLRRAPTVRNNKVFARMAAMGYRLNVYQYDYLDFWAGADLPINSCLQVPAGTVHYLQDAPTIPAHRKSFIIVQHALDTSPASMASRLVEYLRMLDPTRRWRIPFVSASYSRVGPVNATPLLQRLARDVLEEGRGMAFFAHLLIPHYPYVYREDGSIRPDPIDWYGPDHITYPRVTREMRYQQYCEQVLSLYRVLDSWFAELQDRGMLDDAVIMIHGDHGSRMSIAALERTTIDSPLWSDFLRDEYSTLAAMKAPWIRPGRTGVTKSVQALVRDFYEDPEHLLAPEANAPYVWVPRIGLDSRYQRVAYAGEAPHPEDGAEDSSGVPCPLSAQP